MTTTRISSTIAVCILLFASAVFGMWLFFSWMQIEQDIAIQTIMHPEVHAVKQQVTQTTSPLEEDEPVKGLYLTAYSAANEKKLQEIIQLIDETELNAVVIDIKDYSGSILYDSSLPIVEELSLEDVRIQDVQSIIERLHSHDIYTIARQTVFQDPLLARKKPEWALKTFGGGLWRDFKGLAWVDPNNTSVWDYNVEIAKEAIALGFDEINFDYVRFPTDGNTQAIAYPEGMIRHEVMADFYAYISDALQDEPAKISVDLFGLVMDNDEYDLGIGQRLKDVVDVVDAVAPMMYPSHYPAGYAGVTNPAAYPAAVFHQGMKKGVPQFEGKRAQVRPWIQAFHIGAYYGAERIRAQIDAIESYPNGGWLMWNAANRYSDAGLRLENEIE